MLELLLARIARGGSFSTTSLSHELGVSPELLEAMLADLIRAGYLRQVERCGETGCAGCQVAAACQPREKVWVLARS